MESTTSIQRNSSPVQMNFSKFGPGAPHAQFIGRKKDV